jgi:hypothetical protein
MNDQLATEPWIDIVLRGDELALRSAVAGASCPSASKALAEAARHGHLECVQLLIPVSDPKADDSAALRLAAEHGNWECARLLIPVSDPKADHSQTLRWAAEDGHDELVVLLLPLSDPLALGRKDGLNAAATARVGGQYEIARMIDAFVESLDLSACSAMAKKKTPRAL